MKRTTERKWHSWLNGVALTICPSMWRRQRRLWRTSGGGTPLTTPHWPSTARLWRESAALNSWGCTSRRISPGPPTPCHSPRRHNSAYTFSAGWKEQVSHHPSSPHSTGAPLRVCWPAASLSGTGTAVLLTARPSSGQWTRLQRSSVPLSHPSWTFSLHDAPAKPTASWRTPPTHPSHSLFQLLPTWLDLTWSVTTWNWVTVQWPVSYRGFPRLVPLGTGLARVDQRSWVRRMKTDVWVLPALL